MRRRINTNFVVAEFMLLVGNLMVRMCTREALLPNWAIAVLAVASTIPMLLFAIQFFRMLRSDLDEMMQRIVLEGLEFAMVMFVPLAGLYVNVRAAGIIRASLDHHCLNRLGLAQYSWPDQAFQTIDMQS